MRGLVLVRRGWLVLLPALAAVVASVLALDDATQAADLARRLHAEHLPLGQVAAEEIVHVVTDRRAA